MAASLSQQIYWLKLRVDLRLERLSGVDLERDPPRSLHVHTRQAGRRGGGRGGIRIFLWGLATIACYSRFTAQNGATSGWTAPEVTCGLLFSFISKSAFQSFRPPVPPISPHTPQSDPPPPCLPQAFQFSFIQAAHWAAFQFKQEGGPRCILVCDRSCDVGIRLRPKNTARFLISASNVFVFRFLLGLYVCVRLLLVCYGSVECYYSWQDTETWWDGN